MQTFEELEAWKAAREYQKKIRAVVKEFPNEEKYRLTDQLVRSSRSIGDNIAEGFGRFHYLDNCKFCYNARGSLMESYNQLLTASEEHYISEEQFQELKQLYFYLLKVLNGYIKYLRNKPNNSITN